MESEKTQLDVLPSKIKISYALGQTACGIITGIVYASITYFYNTKMGMDGLLLGTAWLIFGIWNTINDPIVSYISDNTRHRLGRRTPYIRYGSWVHGILFILAWYPLVNPEDQIGLFINFIIILVLFDTLFSLIGMCYFCLPAEMTTSAQERGEIGFITSIFNIVGMGVQVAIPVLFLTGNDTTLDPMFRPAVILIGISSAAVMYITSYFVKENQFAQLQPHEPFWLGLKRTFHNKPFFIYEIASFSLQFLMTVISTGAFYYLDYVLKLKYEDILTDYRYYLMIVGIGCVIIGGMKYCLNNIGKLGPRKIMLYSFSIAALGFLLWFFTGHNLLLSAFPIAFVILGAAGALIANPAIIGDVIDYDELITGARREAVYAGFNAIITKPAISLANWAFLGIITWFGFLRPTIEGSQIVYYEQPESATTGILFALTLIPAFFMALSAIAMVFYPLHGEKWAQQKIEIIQMHRDKQAEYEKTLN
jgi:GPH family glycoside/pentoside/hexuronide:cation symporter